MSDSVRPHRCQPTRLPRPWDSPGKNTGAGCHFLLQLRCLVVSNSLQPRGYSPPGSSVRGRQEYWSGLPLPSPGDLPDPGIKESVSPVSSALQADSLPAEPPLANSKRLFWKREGAIFGLSGLRDRESFQGPHGKGKMRTIVLPRLLAACGLEDHFPTPCF